jgi:hypothetical protein
MTSFLFSPAALDLVILYEFGSETEELGAFVFCFRLTSIRDPRRQPTAVNTRAFHFSSPQARPFHRAAHAHFSNPAALACVLYGNVFAARPGRQMPLQAVEECAAEGGGTALSRIFTNTNLPLATT